MDAALMVTRRAASSSLQTRSPSLRSIGTTAASIGARRLPAGQRMSDQVTPRASMTAGENLAARGVRATTGRSVAAWRRAARA